MSNKPNDFWPWSFVTYSPPGESFKETSARWEAERLETVPAGIHWFIVGGIVGIILAIATW